MMLMHNSNKQFENYHIRKMGQYYSGLNLDVYLLSEALKISARHCFSGGCLKIRDNVQVQRLISLLITFIERRLLDISVIISTTWFCLFV